MSSVVIAPARPLGPAPVEQEPRGASRPRLALSSHAYLPACSVAAVAVALVGIGWASHWGGANFAASMTSLRVILAGPLTLLILGVLLIVERVRPAQRR